ncbi:probable thimet oligopeptidase [Neltuma alba]|uniref:probable thimet oligopeptidase n=1 Tax=Neltuma alba TaxID=207710 RepID=UPI0010A590CF|nr:probable thimet oligopeptidase [Prosopis alba]XP_028772247.1 probable thimet oligopeptidase [Prosopis alba]XP_028794078.1 probable thimet oligopeptidase [Prosopis alba]XP_028794079.1 probable thimet oligopeptidase [Prosopis alba]
MTGSEEKSEKMVRQKRDRSLLAFTGAAAVLAIAVNLAITAIKHHKEKNRRKKDLPGSNVRINLSKSEILKLADQIIAKSKEVHDAVASVPLDKATYMNVISPLAELEAQQFPLIQSCVFPKLVSSVEDVRKASAEAERKIDAHLNLCSKREDVYLAVKAFAARGEWMSAEAKCFVQTLVRDFERNGLNLTATKREELLRLRAQIDELSLRYVQNLSDDSSFLLFNESELAGSPPEFLKALDKSEDGKVKISLRSHHVAAVLELCKVGTTRRMVARAYGKRSGEVNLSLLENLVEQRHKYARLLGYSNYAEYVVDIRMARTPTKVFEFLEEISSSLDDLAMKELDLLKNMKKKEEGELPFGIEDLPYYIKRVEEQNYSLDFIELKQYFPISLVLSGIFKILQDIFGLRFEEIVGAEVWHSDVRVFSVLDLGSGELLGYCYLDLYAREGKYGHTCVVALQNNASTISQARQVPVALLISQCQRDAGSNSGLLRFSEVVGLLHEFGHVVQQICNRASFSRLSGLRVDPDFVEIPAQVLENWCYESSSLKLISGFYQDITKPLQEDVCKSIKRWRNSFSALKLKQEILYCLFDQIIHSADNVDILELFKHLHPKVMLGLPMLEGINPASCFPSSVIGYEAACYSRIWSQVFAADIFASKFGNDVSNSNHHVGMQFRNKVLAPGGSKDPIEVLSAFLGREPSIQAYINSRANCTL